jgi:putative transposase
VTRNEQEREILLVREVRPEYKLIHTHVLHNVITRLELAYRGFFRRLRAGEKPGFPRFKGRGSYRTFTFTDAGDRNGVGLVAGGKRVRIFGVGNVKIKLHRPIEGRIKQASVTLCSDGHWYIAFACADVPAKPLPPTGASVGVDVGITTFAALSDGTLIANPRPYESAQYALAKANRRVARRKRWSGRRRKAVALLAKQHCRVARIRRDFQHKLALELVRQYDAIYFEDLNIAGLSRMVRAKQVRDAAWGLFGLITSSKAECAGRWFSRSNPCGTSQTCSGCGKPVPKGLAVRVHSCPHCGLVLDRDVNAARNIESRGQRDREDASRALVPVPRSPDSPELAKCHTYP